MSHEEAEKYITHSLSEEDCKDFKREQTLLEAYRTVFKNDMREVVKEELGVRDEMLATVHELSEQNWPLIIFGKRIYLIPIFSIISIICIVFYIFNHK